MVNVHNVDTTRFCTFLKKTKDEFLRFNSFFLNGRIFFILYVESVKLRESKTIIKSRYIMRGEKRNLTVLNESLIEEFADLNTVIKFANTIILRSFIVLENKNIFYFLVPNGESIFVVNMSELLYIIDC